MGSIKRGIGALLAAGVVALAAAAPAQAGLLVASAQNCDNPASAQVFRAGWTRSTTCSRRGRRGVGRGLDARGGARVLAGNEPWKVGGSGASSLQLPRGSRATTGTMCVGLGHPTHALLRAPDERLAARHADGRGPVRGRRRPGQQPADRRRAGRRVVAADAAAPGAGEPAAAAAGAAAPPSPSGSRRSAVGPGRSTTSTSIPGAPSSRSQAAGTCCVMQWTPPPPSASVSPGTATASRPG